MKPTIRPENPCFSSGPTAKRPGWSLEYLTNAALGRSHRSKLGKTKLKDVIDRSRAVLGIPADYRIGIVPGSDTGAFEMAMWTMLGARGVDVFSWDAFSQGWASDIKGQLKLSDARYFDAPYGELPDLSQADPARDCVFVWNGTTSGARVPDGDWIAADREGLTFCDATSAVMAMEMPWEKLDVVTYSWQKVMGGEAAHGMLILSPRAVERLESYTPAWPVPKLFQLTKNGKLIEGIFSGETINTPSMLCVEDALDFFHWVETVGGAPALMERSEANLEAVTEWLERTPWVDFLTPNPAYRSNTSICLSIVDPWYSALSPDMQEAKAKALVSLLEKEGVAYDIGAYRDAPPGLRLWGGATVETSDLQALFPWLDWAYAQVRDEVKAA